MIFFVNIKEEVTRRFFIDVFMCQITNDFWYAIIGFQENGVFIQKIYMLSY
jgi:hypothetical protein